MLVAASYRNGSRTTDNSDHLVLLRYDPALAVLGVDAMQTHSLSFIMAFWRYYTSGGIGAYAGATIAQANLMQTGNTAFRLGALKLSCRSCSCTRRQCCRIRWFHLGRVFHRHWRVRFRCCYVGCGAHWLFRCRNAAMASLVVSLASILVVAPGMESGAVGMVLALPVLLLQLMFGSAIGL